MHERAAHTFPNISPLMQRAVTFSTQPGGVELIPWYSSRTASVWSAVCEGWRWRELTLAKSESQMRVDVSGRADVWRVVYRGIVLYALIFFPGFMVYEIGFPAWINGSCIYWQYRTVSNTSTLEVSPLVCLSRAHKAKNTWRVLFCPHTFANSIQLEIKQLSLNCDVLLDVQKRDKLRV